MLKPIVIIAILLSVVASCNNVETSATVSAKDSSANGSGQKGWFMTNSTKHVFSDPNAADSFVIVLSGSDSLLDAHVKFEIIDHSGQSIHIDTFSASYLLGYDIENKEAYIKQRIREFFDKDNFLHPAIPPKDTMDADYTESKANWEEIKANPGAVGFYYLTGEENGQRIAYSRKLKKVVVYFSCC